MTRQNGGIGVNSTRGFKPSEQDLLAAMHDPDSGIVADAAMTLGMSGADHAVDALLELLMHAEPPVRSAAASALGLIGSERAIADLRTASSDGDASVASAASVALRRIGDEDAANAACERLVTELCSADPERRGLAARALGGLKSPEAVEPLLATLVDPDPQVRADVASALGWICDPRATTPLTAVGFTDPDPFVRDLAMNAVARIVTLGAAH